MESDSVQKKGKWSPGTAMAGQAVPVQQDLLLTQLALVVGRDNVVVSRSVLPLVGRNIHVMFLPSVCP